MRRILIMGPPGSGKSTLARRLGAKYNLPVFHLDQLYHGPAWVAVAGDVFRAAVERIAALPEWIIDGNYTDTIAPRFAAADTVIYLDVSRWLAMLRIARRLVMGYGHVRSDAAEGCPERLDPAFLHFAWSWNRIRRSRNLALLARFHGTKIVLHGAKQQKQFWRAVQEA